MKPIIFLLLALVGVSMLALTKEKKAPLDPLEQEVAVLRPALSSKQISEGVFIATRPIHKSEWAHFAENTGYRSWRERQGAHETWRQGEPGAAIWLTPQDGRAYCRWLEARAGEEISGYLTYRLPTTDELRQVKQDNCWEWTSDTLFTRDSSSQSNRRYKTAYNGQNYADRLEESLAGDVAPKGAIRVVWESNTL